MNTTKIYEKLMKFLYDKYERGGVFREYGEFAGVLVTEFERKTGLDLGNVYGQAAAIRYLGEQGWIKPVSPLGESIGGSVNSLSCRVQPTPKGIDHVQRTRNPVRVLLLAAEALGRFLKGFLGK